MQAEREAARAAEAPKPIIVKLGGGGGKASSSPDEASAKAEPDAAAGAVDGAVAGDRAAPSTPAQAAAAEPSTPAKAEQQPAEQPAEQAAEPGQQAAAELKADDSKAVALEAGEPPKVLKLRKALLALRNGMADDIVDPVRCAHFVADTQQFSSSANAEIPAPACLKCKAAPGASRHTTLQLRFFSF